VVIYSLRPVSMLSDSAQRKTNAESEMTHFNLNIRATLLKQLENYESNFSFP